MILNVFVDGSGGPNGGYGFFIKETGQSSYEKSPEITNNQAEYKAIILALKSIMPDNELHIFSDSKNTVSQINHEFAINNEKLRSLAQETWSLMNNFPKITIQWIRGIRTLQAKCLEAN